MGSREEFLAVFSKVLDVELADIRDNYQVPEAAVQWIEALHKHSIPGGKLNRGLTVVHALKAIAAPRSLTDEEVFEAQVLGWCIEWLQGFFLVADDLMDSSETRRGEPCWYKTPKPIDGAFGELVGIIACNDSLIVETMLYRILRRYFRSKPYYVDLFELFQEITFRTEVGQLLDLTSQPNTKKNNLDLFTLDTYKKIVEYKTAYYSFYLPVALALFLGGIATPDNLKASMDILLPMGEYFQIQDDFLDCYGAPEVIGKIGRDIEENKCGWLIVQALPLCNAEQRAVLAEFYGVDDPQAVAKVKQLYAQLNITKLFQDFEQESFERISAMITNTTATVPKQVFTDLLAKIYKRSV